MAERIVQEESLLTVADAIREKTGGTEGLAFPEGFVQAISAIQAGGGGSNSGDSYISGSFTLTEDTTTNYEIPFDASSLFADGETVNNNKLNALFIRRSVEDTTTSNSPGMTFGILVRVNSYFGTTINVTGGIISVANNKCKIGGFILNSSSFGLRITFTTDTEYSGFAGSTYDYYVWRADKTQ